MKRVACLFLSLTALLGCKTPTIEEFIAKEGYPFRLLEPSAEARYIRLMLESNRSFNLPEDVNIRLLVLFCPVENADIRKVGAIAKSGWGAQDKEIGAEVVTATVTGATQEEYRGAWWMAKLSLDDWKKRGEVKMWLPQIDRAGAIVGKGYLIMAMVTGEPGHGDYTLLSKQVCISYEEVDPIPAS